MQKLKKPCQGFDKSLDHQIRKRTRKLRDYTQQGTRISDIIKSNLLNI